MEYFKVTEPAALAKLQDFLGLECLVFVDKGALKWDSSLWNQNEVFDWLVSMLNDLSWLNELVLQVGQYVDHKAGRCPIFALNVIEEKLKLLMQVFQDKKRYFSLQIGGQLLEINILAKRVNSRVLCRFLHKFNCSFVYLICQILLFVGLADLVQEHFNRVCSFWDNLFDCFEFPVGEYLAGDGRKESDSQDCNPIEPNHLDLVIVATVEALVVTETHSRDSGRHQVKGLYVLLQVLTILKFVLASVACLQLNHDPATREVVGRHDKLVGGFSPFKQVLERVDIVGECFAKSVRQPLRSIKHVPNVRESQRFQSHADSVKSDMLGYVNLFACSGKTSQEKHVANDGDVGHQVNQEHSSEVRFWDFVNISLKTWVT